MIRARLTGRCASGAELDGGTLAHQVEADAMPWGRALCGARPGRTSGGWQELAPGAGRDCPSCAARLPAEPREGWLVLDGWAGPTAQRVQVIGETPKRLRIRAITRTRLAGRRRWLERGHTALVPRTAVRETRPTWAQDEGGADA